MNQPDFWSNPDNAKSVSQKCEQLRQDLQNWQNLKKEVADLSELAKIAAKENDLTIEKEISDKLEILQKNFAKLEFFILFSGHYDRYNAIVSFHAGTGGVEAQDWAEMLMRMILRFCEKHKFQTKIIDENRGNEAGIKSAAISVSGQFAYGWLKSENGVHRLVRISPFDAEKMRHTSFALIEVLPEITADTDVEIKDQDIKIDVFRSSGHGGQSVNTTDSAVRITHLPSGLVVKCQNERSQLQNKEMAMRFLKAKLMHLQAEKSEKNLADIRGEIFQAEWGNQIRSYVLQPYKMVKDHRTEYETAEAESVLDGGLDGLVESYLRSLKH